jgi:hypothetical protein
VARSGSALQNALLNRAWIQWIALTAELGDADARLRDVSTDWCVAYGRYVNGSRLKQVVRELRTPPDAIGEYVATVAVSGGPTWPMATQPRPEYETRGKARLDPARSRSRLRIRLRAAFGVNARADVLAALLAAPQNGLSVADLARKTRFTKPSTAFAVDALVLAGLLEARTVGNERRLVLTKPGEILPGLRPPIVQPDWVARFGVALEVLRFAERDGMSPSVRAIEARRVVEGLLARSTSEGLPEPNLDTFGDQFSSAFDRWVVQLVDSLRGPSRT